MHSPLAAVMQNHIFRVRRTNKRREEPSSSKQSYLNTYTAGLWDSRWARLAARRNHG